MSMAWEPLWERPHWAYAVTCRIRPRSPPDALAGLGVERVPAAGAVDGQGGAAAAAGVDHVVGLGQGQGQGLLGPDRPHPGLGAVDDDAAADPRRGADAHQVEPLPGEHLPVVGVEMAGLQAPALQMARCSSWGSQLDWPGRRRGGWQASTMGDRKGVLAPQCPRHFSWAGAEMACWHQFTTRPAMLTKALSSCASSLLLRCSSLMAKKPLWAHPPCTANSPQCLGANGAHS